MTTDLHTVTLQNLIAVSAAARAAATAACVAEAARATAEISRRGYAYQEDYFKPRKAADAVREEWAPRVEEAAAALVALPDWERIEGALQSLRDAPMWRNAEGAGGRCYQRPTHTERGWVGTSEPRWARALMSA